MTKKTTTPTASGDERDAEARALWESPAFQAIRRRSLDSATEGGVALEALDGPDDGVDGHAPAYLDALERLSAEQDAEVTDEQGRLLELVLTAADYVEQRGTLAQLAEDSGCSEADIRAVATALTILARMPAAPAPAGR